MQQLAGIRSELAELAGAASDRDDWRGRVEEGLKTRVDQLEQSMSGDANASRERFEATITELRGAVDAVASRLQELGEQRSDDAEGARIADVELAARIDDVALRLAEGTATAEGALRRDLEQLSARLVVAEAAGEGAQQAARDEVERLVASVGWRLERIEESLAAGGAHEAIERLEQRLEAQAAQAEEQVRVTEKALRKGLASLGAQLAESQGAYAESGDALRRSIERLGSAVSDTDARIAGREAASEVSAPYAAATEFVAFAPTEEGYRLVVVGAPLPAVGDEIELPEAPGRLVVTRIGASPLPLDSRPCAYLDRVADRPT